MRKALLWLAAVTLPAIASARSAEPRMAGPVTYEVSSWGRLMIRWSINPDGTGEIWRSGPGQTGDLRKFRLRLEGDALQTFITNIEDVRAATKAGVDCKRELTDLPYGSITWDYPGAGQVYRFDAGCRSEKADEVQDILTAASSNVETLATLEPKPFAVEPNARR